MDPRLAEIYGTNEDISDTEKLAAAKLAEELADDDEIDLDGMSDEEIEALAREVLEGDDSDDDDEYDDAAEKVAEADYLGRVMAHAYVQELKSIEKAAAPEPSAATALAKRSRLREYYGKGKMQLERALKAIKSHPKTTAGVATGLAGLGAGAYLLSRKKGKRKHASATPALDALAEQRALEILEENGIDVNDESDSKYDVLAQAVELRAREMLEDAGYEFED
jgi:hypothetical protein